ncbi:DUF6705 family protein [Elizabethkingia anophelis]|uniref:DUF6705 family protein n=1 Tax=Elizabethkingia anophelis TaxID=1117645 RepID=UPI001178C0E8|nr:DUF6705 family protein [Elizabethkingia anophelis]MCT3734592.1 hypothetical protein [Elizabethkingia anophelis]
MKKLIILNIILLLSNSLAQAQRTKTVSMSEMANYPVGSIMGYPQIPDDVDYLIDDTGLLDKYVGTWKGIANGRNLEFTFTKKLKVDNYTGAAKRDLLMGRLIVKDPNGTVIFDTNNQDEVPLKGWTFTAGLKRYVVNYTGLKLGCNEAGWLFLKLEDGKIKVEFLPMDGIMIEGDGPNRCPKDYVPLINRTGLELTKQ